MRVLSPSLPPASCTSTRMLRSFSGAGVAASVDCTRNCGAKRLKASSPMPRPVVVRNSRRVVGKKGVGLFEAMGKTGLAKLIFARLQERDRGAAEAAQALFFVVAAGREKLPQRGAKVRRDVRGEIGLREFFRGNVGRDGRERRERFVGHREIRDAVRARGEEVELLVGVERILVDRREERLDELAARGE